jgi:hypothetical protein
MISQCHACPDAIGLAAKSWTATLQGRVGFWTGVFGNSFLPASETVANISPNRFEIFSELLSDTVEIYM